ncbi:DUF1989 domain-containing protein [Rhodobacter sp. NTK016B]|uniref:urea carboxylase-associated family protein n=1 Tax=Rhodobacter sp. NTK016B TaxID=2759676 RepID=UPI001A8E41F5|nr:DUF1989 domain-containing protein [Rhodobacter sp. NTK016B]MBN8294874.1 DUF1989 domain-containing protein [Rhodobacter sp. NTK016B]
MPRPVPTPPEDAQARRDVPPVICYPTDSLQPADLMRYARFRDAATPVARHLVPAREGGAFRVPAGGFFRITCVEGPQVGDLNLFNAANPVERFYSGKTRALHGSHLSLGERMWSGFPFLRPMATMVADTLGWYGRDAFGGRVHDVIGTRCDPYTHWHLSGGEMYHHCCHSNLTRALAAEGVAGSVSEAETLVHDVLNVFMCTGFTEETGQYFMKASPVRPGDYVEFFAEIDLLGVLSACPGGDCGAEHSSDSAACHPLQVDVFETPAAALGDWTPPPVNGYDRSHGR